MRLLASPRRATRRAATRVLSHALVAVLGCHAAASAQAASSLAGRVITADAGTPIAGATVRISIEGASTTVETNRSGEFSFTGLPDGWASIRVTCAGFLDARWPGGDVPPDSGVNELKPGATLSDVEIALVRGGAIDGQVIDANGLPAAGRTVVALGGVAVVDAGLESALRWRGAMSGGIKVSIGRPAFDTAFRATTDDRGRFRLHTLPADRYVVGVLPRRGPDHADVPDTTALAEVTWAPGTSRSAAATVFMIDGPQEHAGATIRLATETTSSLSGVVVDADGVAVAGAMVLVSRDEAAEGEAPELSAVSDPRGAFAFDVVPQGRWRVEALRVIGPGRPAKRMRAVTFVDVDAQPAQVRITIRERPVIRGRVVVRTDPAPASWERTGIVSQRVTDVWSVLTSVGVSEIAPDGTFAVQALSDTVELGVVDPPPGFRLERVLVNGHDHTDEALPVTAFDDVEVELEFTSTGGLVAGAVTWPGVPRERCRVLALSTDRARWHAASRHVAMSECQGGRFLFGPLPDGDYYVAAVSSDISLEDHPQLFGTIADHATRVSIARGDVTTRNLRVQVLERPAGRE